jgi:hypothetical protein
VGEAHYSYACVCGINEELSSGLELPSTCPRCGELVGISVISLEEFPAGDPRAIPEFVFSEAQKQRTWPTNFWAQLVRRIRDRELTMNPHELAQGLTRFVPGARERRSPGRPEGGPFRDSADFEARLTDIIVHLHKHHYAITHELIACTLRGLLRTPERYEDLASVVSEAARERREAKAALASLQRWCVHPKHPVDLDQLIQRLTTK